MVTTMNGNSGTPQIWSLQGVDAHTAVDAADFITDALARGMRKGDIVFYTEWDVIATKATLENVTMHVVVTVDAGGADLSNIASVTMTNSD
jgi:hypothetical protein